MPRPTREQMEAQLVELLQTGSASEAEVLAAGLRQRGILAVANAEALPYTSSRPGGARQPFRTFVLVHESDLDAASAVIDDVLGTEGDVPDEHIREEMAAAEEDPDAATAWYYEDPSDKGKLAAVLAKAVVVAAIAVLGWMLTSSF